MEKYTLDTALERLSEITAALEKGEPDLEASMKLYEEGVKLVAFCNRSLNAAAQRVTELSQLDLSGDDENE